jgi:hypothetical protein
MIKTILSKFFKNEKLPLQERMRTYEINGYCDISKTHIVSLKSKQLLKAINDVWRYDDKVEDLQKYNEKLINVCYKLYEYFSPNVIFSFNNEIHLCFYHNGSNNFVFGGNQNKTISTMASYATLVADCVFEATLHEFDYDYEVLNFLIWRQHDCKRNNYTLLYKCKHLEQYLDNTLNIQETKLTDIEKFFKDEYNIINPFVLGNVLKKSIVYKDKTDEEMVLRKEYIVEHFLLSSNFKETLQKYIINKLA